MYRRYSNIGSDRIWWQLESLLKWHPLTPLFYNIKVVKISCGLWFSKELNLLWVALIINYHWRSAFKVVEFLKKSCGIGLAWPGVDLRFCPWLLLFNNWTLWLWPELFSQSLLCASLVKTNEWIKAFFWPIAKVERSLGSGLSTSQWYVLW